MVKEQFNHFKGIVESTLREGKQFHSANFTIEQQIKIVEMLTAIGVDFIEVSNPAGEETAKEVRQLVSLPSRPPILAHIRALTSDVQSAIALNVDGVNILSISDEKRLRSMGTTHDQHLGVLQQSILLAQEAGLSVRVGSEHYFNATDESKERAQKAFRLADNLGVTRISIPDTLGVAMNGKVAEEVGFIRSLVKAEIEVHFHNDLGMANANAISAIENGASYVDTTILGIGERTGITCLSSFLVALYTIDPNLVSKYHLEHLTQVDKSLADMLGIDVPFNMITSSNGVTHKAGIHVKEMIRNGPSSYEPIQPGIIGNTRRIIIGSTVSGSTKPHQLDQFYQQYGTK